MNRSSSSENGNVTVNFRKKHSAFKILKGIFKFLLLVCAVVAVYIFKDEIKNITPARIASVFDFAAISESEVSNVIQLERSSSSQVMPFKNGFAVADGQKLSYIKGNGEEVYTEYVSYANPVLLTGDKCILLYDRGGKGITIGGSGGILKSEKTESKIISVKLSDSGAFSVVTDEDGYRAAVSIYSTKQLNIYVYKWFTSLYYISMATVSPNMKTMAAVCLTEKNGEFNSSIAFFDIQKTEEQTPAAMADLSDEYILDISYIDNNHICAVTETKVIICTADGQFVKSAELNGTVSAFALYEGEMPVVAAADYTGNSTSVYAINSQAETEYSACIDGTPKYMVKSGEYTAIMTDESIFLLDKKLNMAISPADAGRARRISLRKDGSIIGICAEYANIIKAA